jgi:hydroxymethylpyrimidine pyrophosphatase-like HAD family hydrolase
MTTSIKSDTAASLGRIRLIVADIDGCLSRGSGSPFDIQLLSRLAEANIASRTDWNIPAITFCTGRPQPYVECLLQATRGYTPALCEGGTVFFDPVAHRIATHPNFTEREEKLLAELHSHVARQLLRPNVKHEPGKITHITLIIQPPDTPAALFPIAQEIAARFDGEFVVEKTRMCIHFLFRHIHKGVGIDWLSEHTGIAQAEMAGIGDARPDLPFLMKVGLPFAPGNAHEDVKAVCAITSEHADSEAALELLDFVIEHNRALPLVPETMTAGDALEHP